jgi:hypothetical protein
MSTPLRSDEELVHRLPLPLAQLYRRAHNAKTVLERHLTACYLWEAGLKLLASVAVVEYAERGEHDPALAQCLTSLARPTLGHWWEFVRRLLPVLADAGDARFQKACDLVLGRTCDDLPEPPGSMRNSAKSLRTAAAPAPRSASASCSTAWYTPATASSATAPPPAGRTSTTTAWAGPSWRAWPRCSAGSTSWRGGACFRGRGAKPAVAVRASRMHGNRRKELRLLVCWFL